MQTGTDLGERCRTSTLMFGHVVTAKCCSVGGLEHCPGFEGGEARKCDTHLTSDF